MSLFCGSMIAFEVLSKIKESPSRYDFSRRDGWLNLYRLATAITYKNTKSLKGAFEQASLLGFCLASGWNQKNKAFMNQDDYKSVSDLFDIYNFLAQKKTIGVREFKAETKMDEAILKGFHHGYKLALIYSNHQQRDLNPSEKHHLKHEKVQVFFLNRRICGALSRENA